MATENEMKEVPKEIWANVNSALSPNSWDFHNTENGAVINCSPSAKTHLYVHESELTALSNRVRELEGYVRHKDDCGKEMQWPCDCGLDNLLTNTEIER